jgi:hypothetical protein
MQKQRTTGVVALHLVLELEAKTNSQLDVDFDHILVWTPTWKHLSMGITNLDLTP